MRYAGIGIVPLSHRLADGPRQGSVIGMGIAEPCHEDLGRTHTSEQVTDPVRKLVLVIA